MYFANNKNNSRISINMTCFNFDMKISYILLNILFISSLAYADYISPGDIKVHTASYQARNTNFELGIYEYDVKWQGITVASARVEVGESSESSFKVEATAETAKVISLFYKLNFESESTFENKSLKPIHFRTFQKENSREKLREVFFSPDGLIKTKYTNNGKIHEPTEFKTSNSTFDPISAAFLARSLPVKVGTKRKFDIFNGKHRYLIELEVEALETISFKGEEVRAFRVRPSVQKLTDTEGEKRLKYARIWISTDERRDVLKIESQILVGKVSAVLNNFRSRPSTPQPILIADKSLDQYASVGISNKK